MAVTGIGGSTTPLTGAVMTVFSREIYFASQPLLRFEQFAEKKTELGKAPGQTINFLKYSSLSGSAALTEGTAMTKNALASSQIQITVDEHGFATSVSEKLLALSFDDVLNSASKLLGFHYAKSLDGNLRDAVAGTSNVVYGGGKSSRAALDADDFFDTDLVKDAVENLATAKAPKVDGNAYVCFLHPHQARKMRDDSAWINAADYGAATQLFLGEIGRYEDVIFIETTNTRILGTDGNYDADGDATGDTGTANPALAVYEALFIGDNAYGLAEALPVELRDDGVEDFGRQHSLAWYAIYGQGRIEGGHIYRAETA